LADGSHTFKVRATDAAGNTDPTPASYTWTVDTAAPSGTIDINGGDAFTNNTTVNLTLNADDPSPGSGVAEMRFSEDGTTWSEWELFATSKLWTVSSGDGQKIVYVQFKDAAGNESATAQDTIGLETVDPTTTHTHSPAPNANGWNNSDVSVTLNATDNGGSGVKQISYSVNGGEPIMVQQSSVQIPVTDEGETTISYHATDNAGNAEAQQTFTVKIDKSAPDATITSGPSGPTNDTTPTFSFGGSDNLTTSSSLLFSYKVVANGVAPESVAWSEYSSSTSATFGDTTGLGEDSYTFYVKVKDQAGNEDASAAQRSLTMDTTAPTVRSVTPLNKATGVAPGTNVTVTFFERMNRTTITESTFKLYEVNSDGTTTQVTNVTVKLSADGLEAKLNPFGTSPTVLERNTKYKAIVTTGAQDLAGNPLAAKEVWSFRTR
jgi:hypothetical protein